MDSGNSGGSLQSSGDGGIADHPPPLFHPTPDLQPPSNFFNPSSFPHPHPQHQNPNPNSIYDLDSLWSSNPNPIHNVNPNPVDNNPEKLGLITKNSKKRTRASRRAPTTVLTTDTTNFRQMVQEFTGIPAAPFATSASGSAQFSRRLDLYSGLAPMQQQPPLKPSAQKIQQKSSFLNSNFQLTPSESFGITKQPLNLSNLQNQMFPFQSVTQSSALHQVNVTEREDGLIGSSSTGLKRWRGENENLVNFERSGNSQNVVVSVRNEGDDQLQLPGNDESWVRRSD